ncbi:MAG: R3H domain-containing nucleic acid-binding protein [bacterium]|nr:R3H domain-containing nucleic acid-binding protein [bacterium]
MTAKELKIIKDTSAELLKLLGFEAQAEVSENVEENTISVQIETEEAGVLIGYHGEAIASFQVILGMIISKKLGEWHRVVVNVGDYREKREETLTRMALNAAQKAHFSGQPVILSSLSSYERRVIHLALSDNTEIETLSEGEGLDRRLIIKPKT